MEPPEYAGSRLTIRCMEQTSGRSPAREFLQALPDRERLRVTLIIKQLGDRGFLTNDTKFKKLRGTDGIWEIRSGRNRVFCFFAPGQLILALGTVKKSAKAKRTDIERAIRMRAQFTERTRER